MSAAGIEAALLRRMSAIAQPSPGLEDDAVALRTWRPGDAEAVTVACTDRETQRWTGVPDGYTRRDAEAFIAGAEQRRLTGVSLDLAVVAAGDDEELLASVGLVAFTPRHDRAEIGYWVAPQARRRGVALRAVRLLSTWALRELPLARIDLIPHVDNRASQAVAERAGFTREGVLRGFYRGKHGPEDIVMYGLLPEDLER